MENKNVAIDIIREDKTFKFVYVEYDLLTNEAKIIKKEEISPDKYRISYEISKYMANKLLKI